jgi:hypothetical protein
MGLATFETGKQMKPRFRWRSRLPTRFRMVCGVPEQRSSSGWTDTNNLRGLASPPERGPSTTTTRGSELTLDDGLAYLLAERV